MSLDPNVNPFASNYFFPSGPSPDGVPGFPDFAALVAAAIEDGMFIDMHTEAYPGGEIRGQLLYHAAPEPSTLSLLVLGPLLLLVRRGGGAGQNPGVALRRP
ncbi:MAG TPA: CHRD domain-containing protein [Burkholderiaceae bacterium]|nr:CHRD domain-containing protein [Burkholderiaceae bacterium]